MDHDHDHGRQHSYFSLPLAGYGNGVSGSHGTLRSSARCGRTFLAANAAKVTQGGWLPLAIGAAVFLLMTTWKRGRYLQELTANARSETHRLDDSAWARVGLPTRVPGTMFAGNPRRVPLLHNLKHSRVLHERNITYNHHRSDPIC